MSWRIDEIYKISKTVRVRMYDRHGLGFDGNSSFSFDFQLVQELGI